MTIVCLGPSLDPSVHYSYISSSEFLKPIPRLLKSWVQFIRNLQTVVLKLRKPRFSGQLQGLKLKFSANCMILPVADMSVPVFQNEKKSSLHENSIKS